MKDISSMSNEEIEAELDAAQAEPFTEERIKEEEERRFRYRNALRLLDAVMSHDPEKKENGKP